MTEAKNVGEELKRLASRLDDLDNDPIMRQAASNYKAVLRKAKANMRDRYVAAAKQQDRY